MCDVLAGYRGCDIVGSPCAKMGVSEMSIKIKLTEDQVLVIRANADEWARAFRNALETNGVIEVHEADGRTLAINPHRILFWEEVPEGMEQDQVPAGRHPQPA